MSGPSSIPDARRFQVLPGLVILVATFWIYAPVFHGGWLWDDNDLITENPLMSDPAGWWKIWFQPGNSPDFYPITTSIQRLEWNLWGLNTLGYHLVNVALHMAGALLVWRLFDRFGLRLAWLGGLLFAVHPVQVESVAWIAELKNALSLPLFLGTLIAWIDFDRLARWHDYSLALVFFLLALLCKLTVVMFPLVILLYAFWRRGRISLAELKLSTPFFLLSLAVGSIPILSGAWAHTFTHLDPMFVPAGGALGRFVLAGQEFAFYLRQCLWPAKLLPVYPKWPVDVSSPTHYLPWLALTGFVAWCWVRRQSWGKHALLGVGFFLVNLLPCPGFIPAPNMGYAWVMDHFLYLPIIGLIGLAIALLQRVPSRALSMGLVAIVAVVLTLGSHAYAKLYRDSLTLWTYTVRHNPNSWMVRLNLGEAFLGARAYPEAIDQFETALKLNPGYLGIRYDLARALSQGGRLPDAIAQYQAVASVSPDYHDASYFLGTTLVAAQRIPEAKACFEQLLQRNPQHAGAHLALGNILQAEGNTAAATEQFSRAAQADPGSSVQLHYARGHELLKENKLPEALAEYQQAAQLAPRDMDILGDLGVVYVRMGRIPEAAQQFELMLQIDPESAAAHTNMGSLLLTVGKIPEAIAQYQEALRLDPNFTAAQQALARAQEMSKGSAK